MSPHTHLLRSLVAVLILMGAPAVAAPMTYIHEFPHPKVAAHYHPRFLWQLRIQDVRYALIEGVNSIELDLHMRGDEVVANHDGPTLPSPRLGDALSLIMRYKANRPTVQRDGLQFFVVLEPKNNDPALFDAMVKVLEDFAPYLSTSVGPKDGPRGITVVITGSHLKALRERFQREPERLNRLCILENRNYDGEITSLTPGAPRFQWTAIQYPQHRGRVQPLHDGTDTELKGRYNIRVWAAGNSLEEVVADGVDSVNADHEQIPDFVALVRSVNREATTLCKARAGKQ